MTGRIADLGDVLAHHFTAPAPQPQPTPPMPPASPWQPRHTAKACGCGVLDGEECDCQAMLQELRSAPVFLMPAGPRRTKGFRKSTVKARFFAKVQVSADNACMEWTGTRIHNGYGRANVGGRSVLAHRLAYELFIGPIPDGMQLDHLCRNRACVRPDHLEPVTPQENTRRGEGLTAQYARRTHCANGHPLSGENVRVTTRARLCRQCARETDARYKARKRATGVAS